MIICLEHCKVSIRNSETSELSRGAREILHLQAKYLNFRRYKFEIFSCFPILRNRSIHLNHQRTLTPFVQRTIETTNHRNNKTNHRNNKTHLDRVIATPSSPYCRTFEALLPHLRGSIAVPRPPYCRTFAALLSHLRSIIATPLWLLFRGRLIAGVIVTPSRRYCYTFVALLLFGRRLLPRLRLLIHAPTRCYCHTFVALLLFRGCLIAAPLPSYCRTFAALLPYLCGVIAVLLFL